MPRVPNPKQPAVKKTAGAKKKKLYDTPEPIPNGEILTDVSKTQWKIGPSIGTGGFGEIYSACKLADAGKLKPEQYNCVIKCEPHDNGPLFVEMHFYMRNAKLEDIQKFKKTHNLKFLGMPHMMGNGSHQLNDKKHRFIVMPRFGKDISKFFLENGRKIPESTIYRIAIQMIDVYKYIHTCGYVHADLKGANILIGFGKGGAGEAYLVDYGLASHYTTKDFKPDPKKMHNGTPEYTSRDAHQGVATMRADFEILGYNIIEWCGVQLPWVKNKITEPIKIQKYKEELMSDVSKNLRNIFPKGVPVAVSEFMNYVAKLKYNESPDYEKCKNIFSNALKIMKIPNSGDFDFKLKSSKDATTKIPNVKHLNTTVENGDDDSDSIFENDKPVNFAKNNMYKNILNKSIGSPSKMTTPTKETPKKRTPKRETSKNTPETKVSPSLRSSRSTPVTKANINFSPVVSLNQMKPGKTVINDNLTPNSKSGKTYEFNFELEVSMDANVIVNVKRKKKANADEEDTKSKSDSPVTRVKVRKLDSKESHKTKSSKSKSGSTPKSK